MQLSFQKAGGVERLGFALEPFTKFFQHDILANLAGWDAPGYYSAEP